MGGLTREQDGIDAAAKLLNGKLRQSGDNIIFALGAYNGWSAAGGGTGPALTCGMADGVNLDYVQQVLNGWMQGVDGSGVGRYRGGSRC